MATGSVGSDTMMSGFLAITVCRLATWVFGSNLASVVATTSMPKRSNSELRPLIWACDQSSPPVCMTMAALSPNDLICATSSSVRSALLGGEAVSPLGPLLKTCPAISWRA